MHLKTPEYEKKDTLVYLGRWYANGCNLFGGKLAISIRIKDAQTFWSRNPTCKNRS